MKPDTEPLEITTKAALKDVPTVHADGSSRTPVLEGFRQRVGKTHVDGRGTVTELFDSRWDWHPDPFVFAYTYTIREGRAKGWGLHERHEDRYFLLEGRMQIVCYDVRPNSKTRGQISEIILSPENPRIVSIPTYVWHANINIGNGEVRVINFPTEAYDHDNPDKLRLPLDTDVIPYKIEASMGW